MKPQQSTLMLYRYRSPRTRRWAMLNARERGAALSEAKRCDPRVKPEDLEFWDGARYVPAY